MAQRRGVPLGVRALGVSGATLLRPSGALCLGRRSPDVTQHPGAWELVPSGGVTPEARDADGAIDPLAQLLDELEEETGLFRAGVVRSAALGIVEDLDDRVIDLVYRLDVSATPDEALRSMRGRPEYPAAGLARRDANGVWRSEPTEALADVEHDAGRVPTVEAILALLDEHRGPPVD